MIIRSRLLTAAMVCCGAAVVATLPLAAGAASPQNDDRALAAELERLILDNPADASLARKLAAVFERTGAVDQAQAWLEYADAIDPHGAMIREALKTSGAVATPRGATGPDIIVGVMTDTKRHSLGDPRPYTLGAASCNIGDENANWFADTQDHPVIAQQVYRLRDGRFEQLGLSWAKHGFVVIPEELCGGPCIDPDGGDLLGPGCSDTYSAATNGTISRLGPRTEVNPSDGTFSVPWAEPQGGNFAGYIFIDRDDLDPALNAEARYFAEIQYIAADDSAAGNHMNNVSHREFEVDLPGGFPSFDFVYPVGSTTQPMQPAIMAWANVDPSVTITTIDVPNDGRLYLAWKVTETQDPDRPWSYEYALYNMNSHRAARSFRLPAGTGVDIGDIGFKDIDYHSGDGVGGVNVDGTDWASAIAAGELAWTTGDAATNANGNALRWGTLYNFRFTSDQPPATAMATIDLFRAGSPASVAVETVAPAASCQGDIDGDGQVGSSDLALLLGNWGLMTPSADFDQSGTVGSADLALLLGLWGPCQ